MLLVQHIECVKHILPFNIQVVAKIMKIPMYIVVKKQLLGSYFIGFFNIFDIPHGLNIGIMTEFIHF